MNFYAEISPIADDDITDTVDYIGNRLHNPVAAKRFYKEVHRIRVLLEENPYMFALYHDDKMAADGCRYAVIGNYIMLYLIDEPNRIVNIIRIIYGKRDIPTVYGETPVTP